jgi:hypothetical protein
MRGTVLIALMVAAAASSGCGGGNGGGGGGAGGGGGGGTTGTDGGPSGATCSSNASCGGDIVGTWAIVQACDVKIVKAKTCDAETYSVSDQTQTGTLVFRADGTATATVTTSGTLTDLAPASCQTSGETCADVDASFKALVQTGTMYTSASCADDAGTCVCTLAVHLTSDRTAPYTTSGSSLILGNSTASYCVTGSTLIISSPDATGGPPTIDVLTRQ